MLFASDEPWGDFSGEVARMRTAAGDGTLGQSMLRDNYAALYDKSDRAPALRGTRLLGTERHPDGAASTLTGLRQALKGSRPMACLEEQ